MSKGERRRTIVYSNLGKKADLKSASQNDNELNWEDVIIIGVNNPIDNNKKKKTKKKDEAEGQKNDVNKNNKKTKKKLITQNTELVPKKKMSKKEIIQMQKKMAIKKISTFVLLILLIIGAVIYIFLSPLFNIKSIEVINNNCISTGQIINLSGLSTNENVLKFSKKEVRNNILSNPYIEDAKIKRDIFSNKVQIEIKERTATLMLEYGNSYVYINNQGYILENSVEKIDSPIINGYITPLEEIRPGNRLNKEDLSRLENVLKIIESANSNGLGDLITKINIKNKKDFIVTMETEDKTVYLGSCTDLSTQMLYIKEMLKREQGKEGEFYLDMDLNTSNPVFKEKV